MEAPLGRLCVSHGVTPALRLMLSIRLIPSQRLLPRGGPPEVIPPPPKAVVNDSRALRLLVKRAGRWAPLCLGGFELPWGVRGGGGVLRYGVPPPLPELSHAGCPQVIVMSGHETIRVLEVGVDAAPPAEEERRAAAVPRGGGLQGSPARSGDAGAEDGQPGSETPRGTEGSGGAFGSAQSSAPSLLLRHSIPHHGVRTPTPCVGAGGYPRPAERCCAPIC